MLTLTASHFVRLLDQLGCILLLGSTAIALNQLASFNSTRRKTYGYKLQKNNSRVA